MNENSPETEVSGTEQDGSGVYHIESVDFDPTVPELASPIEGGRHESSRDYSPIAIMERLDPYMDAGVVGSAIYGAAYSARANGYVRDFDNENIRDVLIARLGALTEDDRMRVASAVGTLRFEGGLAKNTAESFRLSDEAGAEISSILFPDIRSVEGMQYPLEWNATTSIMKYLEKGGNVVSDSIYGRLYGSALSGGIPPVERGQENQIIYARLQVLAEDPTQSARLREVVDRLEDPNADRADVAKQLCELLFPSS